MLKKKLPRCEWGKRRPPDSIRVFFPKWIPTISKFRIASKWSHLVCRLPEIVICRPWWSPRYARGISGQTLGCTPSVCTQGWVLVRRWWGSLRSGHWARSRPDWRSRPPGTSARAWASRPNGFPWSSWFCSNCSFWARCLVCCCSVPRQTSSGWRTAWAQPAARGFPWSSSNWAAWSSGGRSILLFPPELTTSGGPIWRAAAPRPGSWTSISQCIFAGASRCRSATACPRQ